MPPNHAPLVEALLDPRLSGESTNSCATTWCVYLSAAKHSLLVRFDSSSRDNLANSRPVTAALFTEEPSGMTSKMSYARYTATPLRASCIGVNDGSGAERRTFLNHLKVSLRCGYLVESVDPRGGRRQVPNLWRKRPSKRDP